MNEATLEDGSTRVKKLIVLLLRSSTCFVWSVKIWKQKFSQTFISLLQMLSHFHSQSTLFLSLHFLWGRKLWVKDVLGWSPCRYWYTDKERRRKGFGKHRWQILKTWHKRDYCRLRGMIQQLTILQGFSVRMQNKFSELFMWSTKLLFIRKINWINNICILQITIISQRVTSSLFLSVNKYWIITISHQNIFIKPDIKDYIHVPFHINFSTKISKNIFKTLKVFVASVLHVHLL